jgi:hypothetical protein
LHEGLLSRLLSQLSLAEDPMGDGKDQAAIRPVHGSNGVRITSSESLGIRFVQHRGKH